VMTMVDHIQGKKVPTKIDTGVFLITAENMNEPEMQKLIKPPLDEYLK
jgi:ribose transport system substrate-binding protein